MACLETLEMGSTIAKNSASDVDGSGTASEPLPELGQQLHRVGTHLRGVHPSRGQRPTTAVYEPGRALFHRTALRHTEFQKTDLASQHTLLRRLQPSEQKQGGACRIPARGA